MKNALTKDSSNATISTPSVFSQVTLEVNISMVTLLVKWSGQELGD
jgi:hypothetical protein